MKRLMLLVALFPFALYADGGFILPEGASPKPPDSGTAWRRQSTGTHATTELRGAPLNPSEFRWSRPIPAVSPGPARLLLDAEALVHSTGIDDLRIVDPSNNQVPYLVEPRSDPLVANLEVPERVARERRSVYTLVLPYDSLPPGTKVVITTSARVFSRSIELRRPNDARDRLPQTIATAIWSNSDPDRAALPLTLDMPLRGTKSVELLLDEGDNAPLTLTSAELLIPAVALRFYHPDKPLRLLYGKPNAAPPRYDLELLASRVFGEPARDITLPPPSPAQPERTPQTTKIFWAAIAVAVMALFAVLARLIGGRVGDES